MPSLRKTYACRCLLDFECTDVCMQVVNQESLLVVSMLASFTRGCQSCYARSKTVTLLLDWAPSVDEGACQYESSTAVCPAHPSTAAGTWHEAAVHGDQKLWPSLMAHLRPHNILSACLCCLAMDTYIQLHFLVVHQYGKLLTPEQSMWMGFSQKS